MTEGTKRYQVFLADLKRRHVFKVAALYGAVAFAVMQAAEFLVPALYLPESVATAIAVIAILGFPIAMVLAWIFDVTRQGVVRTHPASTDELEAIVAEPAGRRWPAGVLGLVGVVLLAGGVWWSVGIDDASTPQVINAASPVSSSIAVLPFIDMSSDGQNEYFSEGISRQLLTALTRVPGLKVAAPTSAFAFRGIGVEVSTIGERLDVATVLEGSCARSGDRLRIAVKLVRAADGTRLWSATYERQREEIFVVLNEIASAIVGALGITLHDGAAANLVLSSTADVAAYDDYLRGQYFAGQHTLAALDSAISFYNRALLLDPDFAAVYAALGEAYMLVPDYGGLPMVDLLPYARAATRRAIALGPGLAEAHAASAHLKWVYEWDREGAERDYLRAIELNPNYANAHYWYAQYLGTLRRWEEGLAEADRAAALDPLSPGIHLTRGLLLAVNGRSADAKAAFQRSLELEPNMYTAAYLLAIFCAMEGDYNGAAEMFERFAQLTDSDPAAFHAYLAALSDPSQRPAAVEALQNIGFYGAMQGSELLAHLGETDAALAALERAVRERSPYLPWANALPQFDTLRSNPRFQAIIAWMGL
ncbi:MAG: tetratricopeptide repeat protein [Gemmatimonadota bacterium]|nr:MAG: tetratricopeptide repeat protein [Gemmatimonadota bacterium]